VPDAAVAAPARASDDLPGQGWVVRAWAPAVAVCGCVGVIQDTEGAGDGRAAPKLKDAELSDDRARTLYLSLVKTVRTLYHRCRLVHADLSEYNLLYVMTSFPCRRNAPPQRDSDGTRGCARPPVCPVASQHRHKEAERGGTRACRRCSRVDVRALEPWCACAVVGGRYYKGEAYVIDVSQSVEHDHPHALDFLRMDCTNLTSACIVGDGAPISLSVSCAC
jgi:hypothetical protein